MTTRIAVITPTSANRLDHLRRQRRFLAQIPTPGIDVMRVEAWLDADEPPAVDGVTWVHMPPGRDGMRVGAARNAAARVAMDHGVDDTA